MTRNWPPLEVDEEPAIRRKIHRRRAASHVGPGASRLDMPLVWIASDNDREIAAAAQAAPDGNHLWVDRP